MLRLITMELTGKQKRILRSIGQQLDDLAYIGKSGTTESAISHLNHLLDSHELIKVRIGGLHGAQRKVFAEKIAMATQSVLVGVVGKTMVLYRPNEKLPANKRINISNAQ